MAVSLVAAQDLPDPPYPPDVRARGWTFQLDMERIEQSITWLLAPADIRPWLLMLWAKAWTCAPCGSLEGDDEIIAARIGMEPRLFKAHRDRLLRGWTLCKDGRLYHPIITELVEAMRDSRAKERAKKRAQREAAPAPDDAAEKAGETKALPCPHGAIQALYNEILGDTLPQAKTWTAARQKAAKARWREVAQVKHWPAIEDGLTWFRRFFEEAGKDDFIMGRSKRGAGHESWEASVDYLLSPKGFQRVFEGHGRKAA